MMKYAFVLLLSSILAAGSVAAEVITGAWGRHMMYGGGLGWGIFSCLFFFGLLLIVWLWVIKLWREVFPGRRR